MGGKLYPGVQRRAHLGPGVKGGITLKITHKISMDLDRYSVPGFDAVCGDRYTRVLEIALYENGAAWEIPGDASVTVRYQKPDGTAGAYDLLPDGTAAWGISGNVVTVTAAPQTLTVPGCVILTVCLTVGERELSTFQILMNVRPGVGMVETDSGDYWYLSGSLPQPENAAVGEVLVVESVDSQGRVTGLKTGGVPGLTEDQFRTLTALLKLVPYTEDPAQAWAALYAAFGVGIPATGITLSANMLMMTAGTSSQITATVTPEDTTDVLTWSSSDPAVAEVSDGSVSAVSAGKCTVTASVGAVSASCSVSVSAAMPTYYSVGYNMTNASCSSTAGSVSMGSSYTAEVTADEGYVLESVTVTMGGTDITESVYADGVISIPSVTGAVVITAAAVQENGWIEVRYVAKAGYYKAGVLTSWGTVYNTGLVAVGDATRLHCTPSAWGNHYATFFDADCGYLSQQEFNVTEATEVTIDIPETAVYFAVAYYEAEQDSLNLGVDRENVRHLITNSLVGDDRAITNVIDGSAYTAALTSAATAVTMGGVDITAAAYADGTVTIEAVTGDVVIT